MERIRDSDIFQLLETFKQSENNDYIFHWMIRQIENWIRIPKYLSYSRTEYCKDIIWEKLNTGHWMNVQVSWRQLYSLIIVLQLRSIERLRLSRQMNLTEALLKDMIKICDWGCLLGIPILNNICESLASFWSSQLTPDSSPLIKKKKTRMICRREETVVDKCTLFDNYPEIPKILSVESLNLEDFLQNYKIPQVPVIIRGSIDDWPALSNWNLEYFRRLGGSRTVPIEIGQKYTDEDWSQRLMTLDSFITHYIEKSSGKSIGYLAQHALFEQIKELKRDFDVPEYCYGEDDVDINGWFGPSGTVSPLHTDPKHNIFAQVSGHKYIRLYAKNTSNMYPYNSESLLQNTSSINLEDFRQEEYPEFNLTKCQHAILKPGELLYIPPQTWHFVKSLSVSFSISFWF